MSATSSARKRCKSSHLPRLESSSTSFVVAKFTGLFFWLIAMEDTQEVNSSFHCVEGNALSETVRPSSVEMKAALMSELSMSLDFCKMNTAEQPSFAVCARIDRKSLRNPPAMSLI